MRQQNLSVQCLIESVVNGLIKNGLFMYRNDKFSKSQIDRQFIDYLGLKNVSVKKFRDRVLPNIPYTYERRGMPYERTRQKRTRVYKAGDIVDYILSEAKKLKKK